MVGSLARRPAVFAAAVALASSCTSHPVSETQALEGETLLALQRSVLTGEELSVTTTQVLSVLDLLDDWEETPSATPDRVSAVPGGQPEWLKRVARGELYYALAERASDPGEAQTLYLEAVLTAHLAMRDSAILTAAFDPRHRLLAGIYNLGLARFLMLGQENHGHLATWTSVARLHGEERFRIARGKHLYDPEYFDTYLAAAELSFSGRLHNRHREYGVGAALIGVRERGKATGRELAQYELPNLQTLPVTAVLRVAEDGTLELLLVNSFETSSVQGTLGQLLLAADFTAPLGHMIAQLQDPYEDDDLGFFDPDELEAERGIYMMQPYAPTRIPVLLVHGLWSSPITWIEVVNEIWGDVELRARYQIWLYLYPTGLSIPTNAAVLRRQLLEMRQKLDPEDDDPAMQDMVVVGHSMGGILAKTLVSTGGDELWNQVVTVPLNQIVASDEDREALRSRAYFEPLRFVNRVVFLATPHRGAPMADNLIGTIGDWMISLPLDDEATVERILRDNPGALPGYEDAHSSIDDLSPSSEMLLTLTALPMREGLPYHSIMGDVTDLGPPDAEDGVVEYRSSHLAGARSELVVEHGHSVQQDPQAQLEIRRILAEHLRSREREVRDL